MAKALPYFKWYPADAETDERYASMTDQELGFYHHCLNRSWINDGLPVEMDELARMMHVKGGYLAKVWPRVSCCFIIVGDRYRNKRQEEEREAANSKQLKCGQSAAQQEKLKIPGSVYLIRRSDGAVKIGSSNNVARRLAQLRYRYKDVSMELVAEFQVQSMGDFELELQERFRVKRLEGEWFAITLEEIKTITPKGDSEGDSNNHPAPRALARADSDSGSDSDVPSESEKRFWISKTMLDFPGARILGKLPDERIISQCYDLAHGDMNALARAFRALHLTGQKPTISWAWFPKVLPQYMENGR